jgi:hypothetical protein
MTSATTAEITTAPKYQGVKPPQDHLDGEDGAGDRCVESGRNATRRATGNQASNSIV